MGSDYRTHTRRPPLAVALAGGLLLSIVAAGLLGMTGLDGASAPIPALAMGTTGSSGAERCELCHVIEPIFSHPVDFAPSMSIPDHLPLRDGRLTCVTCHDAASSARHDAAALSADGDQLLRVEATRLCAECHAPEGSSRVDLHAGMVGRAHLPGAHLAGTSGASDPPRGSADSGTDLCLSCHDGTIASDLGHQQIDPSIPRRWRLATTSHPVGMEYPRVTGSLRDPPLRASERLDPRIRLFEGQVACTSCHSPFSPERDLLVMSNAGSALCLSCHEF